jgi:uncharacterized protein YjbI with pentapeptide repeats
MKTLIATLCALALALPFARGADASVPKACTGCNFSGAKLSGADFASAVYVGSDFSNADLRSANFAHARLIGANFRNADLRGANFDGANCTGCDLRGARLSGAWFANARLTGANLRGLNTGLDDAALRSLLMRCTGCDLRDAHLVRRNLSGIALIGIDFSGADLRGTNLDGDQLCWYNDGGRDVACDDLRAAQVSGASFRNVTLCEHRRHCSPVDAQTLRRYGRSPLNGAILP